MCLSHLPTHQPRPLLRCLRRCFQRCTHSQTQLNLGTFSTEWPEGRDFPKIISEAAVEGSAFAVVSADLHAHQRYVSGQNNPRWGGLKRDWRKMILGLQFNCDLFWLFFLHRKWLSTPSIPTNHSDVITVAVKRYSKRCKPRHSYATWITTPHHHDLPLSSLPYQQKSDWFEPDKEEFQHGGQKNQTLEQRSHCT